jgi:hypothetical protein
MHLYILFTALVGLGAADVSLKPAKRHDSLSRRSDEIFLAENVELTYAEDIGAHASGSVYKSHFRLQVDKPILLLEDFDHLFQDVRCSGPIMTITMLSSHVYKKARSVCEPLKGGMLISSHFSCGEDDQHAFYRVLGLDFDDGSSSITLELESRPFEKSFHSVKFHLGHSSERVSVHQHDRLFKRQDESTSSDATASSTAPAEVTGTYVTTMPLATSYMNSSIPDLPIDFGCTNCSTTGELVLTTVELELHDSDTDDDYIKSGSIQFDLKGFNLNIGLRAVPSVSFTLPIPIFITPTFGYNVGPAAVGIDFSLEIVLDVQASGGVELGFGFDVNVPDSTIYINIAEFQDSYISGLNGTKVTARSLEANASDIDVTLSAALRPGLNFGVTLAGIRLAAGPYLDLPRLNMTASQLATDEIGANCQRNGDTDAKFKEAFQNLTHVQYNVDLAAGLQVDLPLRNWDTSTQLLSTQFPIATQCLVWQGKGTTTQFAPATAVLASMTAPPSSTGSGGPGKKSAGMTLHDPPIGILAIIAIIMPVFLELF